MLSKVEKILFITLLSSVCVTVISSLCPMFLFVQYLFGISILVDIVSVMALSVISSGEFMMSKEDENFDYDKWYNNLD